MSWMAEEWKEKLPSDALKNIQTMENTLEHLHKDVSQYQFKIESLEAALENSKQKLEEKVKENQQFEREKYDLQDRLDDNIVKCRELSNSNKQKDDAILEYIEQLSHWKEKFGLENAEREKLENELENLQDKYGMDSEQAKKGTNRLNEAHEISKQRIHELKIRIEKITKENRSEVVAYETKLQTALDNKAELAELNRTLNKRISSLENQNQAVIAERNKFEKQLKEIQDDIARLKNEEKMVKPDEKKIKNIIRAKDFEIQELKAKLTTLEHQGSIGTYLGIDVKQICSETQICQKDKPDLIRHNKALQEEVHRLTRLAENHQWNCNNFESKQGPIVNSVLGRQEENFDSGFALRGDSDNVTECDKEVLISRIEQTPSSLMICDRSEIDNISSMCIESVNETNKICDDDTFEHGPDCVLISQRLFESNAVLNSYKGENKKLKQEIYQMKEVYENHMKICTQDKIMSRKSVERIIPVKEQNVLVDDLKKKLSMEEQTRKDLLLCLQEQESKCMLLERRLSSNATISTTAVNKLEELVDVISQQRNNLTSVECSQHPDIERILSELTNSFISIHEEITEGHELTRESINTSTENILQALRHQSIGEFTGKERSSSKSRRYERNQLKKYVSSSGNGIDELENIKEMIGDVQEIIYGYGSDIRKVEEERDRLQEELIRMVDVMKTKDEEHGRLSYLYEEEKRKVGENDSCFHQEMQAIKTEQLEIYQEYRDMCDNLKKKEIELLNKTKQMKLLNAEWRDKEDSLNDKILNLQKENSMVSDQRQELEQLFNEKSVECELLISRLINTEEQIQPIFDNLSRIEDMFYEAKTQGLYS